MREYIEECIKTRIQVYKSDEKLIKADYNLECEKIQDYHGRELLELIQNADDALNDIDNSNQVMISFSNNYLTISNNGKPFTKAGIDSLMHAHLSQKSEEKGLIGNKGTGFRSILGWAEEVKIHSDDLHIRFSPEYAQTILHKNFPEIETKNSKVRAATLVFPEWIDETFNNEYITSIIIKTINNESVKNSILKQIRELNSELLLFLQNIQSILIRLDDGSILYKKESKNGHVRIEKIVNDKLNDSVEWETNRFDGKIVNEKQNNTYSIVIAYRSDYSLPERQYLYSYFPTKIEFPYPVLLHADLQLTADRNRLIEDDNNNRIVLKKAAELYIKTAEKITRQSSSSNYNALKLLVPTKKETLPDELFDYGFFDEFDADLKTAKVLPNVNDRYISFADFPVYNPKLSDILSGNQFERLLKETNSTNVLDFIYQQNAGYSDDSVDLKFDLRYDMDELANLLNEWVKNIKISTYSYSDCAKLMMCIYKTYGYISRRPSIIVDDQNNFLNEEDQIFINDGENIITDIPVNAKIKIMNSNITDCLHKLVQDENEFESILLSYSIDRLEIDNLIRNIRNEIGSKSNNNDFINGANSLIKFCWENRSCLCNDKVEWIYLPTIKGTYDESFHLYFGNKYNISVCENFKLKIFDSVIVDDIREIINDNPPIDDLINFLSLFEVEKFPRKNTDYSFSDGEKYWLYSLKNMIFPFTLDNETIDNVEQLKRDDIKFQSISCISAYGLSDILNGSSTASIINWISQDIELQRNLFEQNNEKA